MADYSTEEKQVLRLAEHFRSMVETEWWKEYRKVLDEQIRQRELLVSLPLSDKSPAFEGLDFMTRASKIETLKGAIIGLRLALSIPDLTIGHSKDIVREADQQEES